VLAVTGAGVSDISTVVKPSWALFPNFFEIPRECKGRIEGTGVHCKFARETWTRCVIVENTSAL
jgi:hypothetical protein